MQKLYFDSHVFCGQGGYQVRIEFDNDADIDRVNPFELRIDPVVLEQAYNDNFPGDKGGFWNLHHSDRNTWSEFILMWAKENIFFLNRIGELERQVEAKNQLIQINEAQIKDLKTEIGLHKLGKDLTKEQRQAKEQYGQVKGEVITVESAINFINGTELNCRKGREYPRKTA